MAHCYQNASAGEGKEWRDGKYLTQTTDKRYEVILARRAASVAAKHVEDPEPKKEVICGSL